MFSTGNLLPVGEVPGGTTLLCVGPPMAGKREFLLRLLATETKSVDATVLLSTDSSSRGVRADYAALVDGEQPRVGVVDCTGETYGTDVASTDDLTVSSRPDPGAVGAAVADLLEVIDDETGRTRIGILSLTSLALHTGEDATARFVRGLADLVDQREGLAVLTVHTDSVGREMTARFGDLVDGVVTVRESEDGLEVQLDGLDAPADWHPVSLHGYVRADVADAEPTPLAREPESTTPVAVEFDSLADVIARFDDRRPTLTVCNRDRPDHAFERVRGYFDRIGVPVIETALGTGAPRDVALLHRGDELVAASPLPAIEAGIASETADADPFASERTPSVLAAIDGDVYGAIDMDKRSLLDASTAIEMTAWRVGTGTFHAGFQRLSRFWESERSRRVMRKLAEAGVSVHVYGEPDADAEPDHRNQTIHAVTAPEIARTWFVAFDGGGHPDQRAALVVEQRGWDRYHGFWTYESDLAAQIEAYVASTYLDRDEESASPT